MSASDAEKWNAKYADREDVDDEPIPFIVDNLSRLGSGSALVLAAGCGRHAVFLAQNGFEVTALDISEVGLACCSALAESRGTSLKTVCADLDDYDLGYSRYDLITMIYFYQPGLFPAIRSALKLGGVLFLPYLLGRTRERGHVRPTQFGLPRKFARPVRSVRGGPTGSV